MWGTALDSVEGVPQITSDNQDVVLELLQNFS